MNKQVLTGLQQLKERARSRAHVMS